MAFGGASDRARRVRTGPERGLDAGQIKPASVCKLVRVLGNRSRRRRGVALVGLNAQSRRKGWIKYNDGVLRPTKLIPPMPAWAGGAFLFVASSVVSDAGAYPSSRF